MYLLCSCLSTISLSVILHNQTSLILFSNLHHEGNEKTLLERHITRWIGNIGINEKIVSNSATQKFKKKMVSNFLQLLLMLNYPYN